MNIKKIGIPIILAGAIIASCTKKTETVAEQPNDSAGVFIDEENVADSTLSASSACYLDVVGKDSLFVRIDDNLGTISGKMHYKNFEKDSSYGDLTGIVSGDTIKAEYVFEAEGTTSTREIWFLRKDGNLLEGIGEYDATGENYANGSSVKFEKGHTLKPADCTEISAKLVP